MHQLAKQARHTKETIHQQMLVSIAAMLCRENCVGPEFMEALIPHMHKRGYTFELDEEGYLQITNFKAPSKL